MKKSKLLKSLLVAFLIIPCLLVFTACSMIPVETINGRDGVNGVTPHIGTNGNWWIGDTDTGIRAIALDGEDGKNGANGLTPYIGANWNWWIGDTDTGKVALGKDAQIPHIYEGNWWIGDTDTGHPAIGQNGKDGHNGITPHIGENGNWWYGDLDTGWPALGENGKNGTNGQNGQDGLTPFIRDGTWWIGDYDTGIMANVDVLHAEYQALLNYLIEMNKTIAYLQSLFTPAPMSFDVDSWQTIANVSASGMAQNIYSVGDEKTVMLKDGEVITVVILDFNHDDLASGLGKAGISLGMKELMATNSSMNAVAGNGWQNSVMRNTTLVDIYDRLPDALQVIIKTVNKTSLVGGSGAVGEPNNNTVVTADKLWLLSRVEVDGTTLDGFVDEGTQYAYWVGKTANADRVKRQVNGTGSAFAWWLRSSTTTSTTAFNAVNPNGAFNVGASSTGSMGISFGFCI